jgi:hypothetical protein
MPESPFNIKKKAPEAVAEASIEVPETDAVEAFETEKPERKKSDKPRKQSAPPLSDEAREFIIKQYASMGTSEIAAHLTNQTGNEVTKQQVYRTAYDFRMTLLKRREEAVASGNQKTVAKIDKMLELVPKKEAFGGRKPGGKKAVDTLIDSLFDEL